MSSKNFISQFNKFTWFDYTKILKATRKKQLQMFTINLYHYPANKPKAQLIMGSTVSAYRKNLFF